MGIKIWEYNMIYYVVVSVDNALQVSKILALASQRKIKVIHR